MEKMIKVFNNEKINANIRCFTSCKTGTPVVWFSVNDLVDSLGYKRSTDLLNKIDPRDRNCLTYKALSNSLVAKHPEFSQFFKKENDFSDKWFTNISGLFTAIMSSHIDAAKEFQHWVTSEVLPAIFTKGAYIAPNATPSQLKSLMNEIHNLKESNRTLIAEKLIAEETASQLDHKYYALNQERKADDLISKFAEKCGFARALRTTGEFDTSDYIIFSKGKGRKETKADVKILNPKYEMLTEPLLIDKSKVESNDLIIWSFEASKTVYFQDCKFIPMYAELTNLYGKDVYVIEKRKCNEVEL